MTEEMGWKQLQLDVVFFCYYSGDRLAGMLIVHVDDCMVAHDGSPEMRAKEKQLKDRFPFGSWTVVAEQAEGDVYTGRRVKVRDNGVEVGMPDFVEGRLEEVQYNRTEKVRPLYLPSARRSFNRRRGRCTGWPASTGYIMHSRRIGSKNYRRPPRTRTHES